MIAPRTKALAQPIWGHQGMGGKADGAGRRDHEPDREQADRPRVGLEHLPVRHPAAREEQRRQDDEEDEVRIDFDRRQLRGEGHQGAADHERDRVGHGKPLRDDGHDDDGGQHDEQEARSVHAAPASPWALVAPAAPPHRRRPATPPF